jgi:hypothetical protein
VFSAKPSRQSFDSTKIHFSVRSLRVKGRPAAQVKTSVVPAAGENAVLDAAAVERKIPHAGNGCRATEPSSWRFFIWAGKHGGSRRIRRSAENNRSETRRGPRRAPNALQLYGGRVSGRGLANIPAPQPLPPLQKLAKLLILSCRQRSLVSLTELPIATVRLRLSVQQASSGRRSRWGLGLANGSNALSPEPR